MIESPTSENAPSDYQNKNFIQTQTPIYKNTNPQSRSHVTRRNKNNNTPRSQQCSFPTHRHTLCRWYRRNKLRQLLLIPPPNVWQFTKIRFSYFYVFLKTVFSRRHPWLHHTDPTRLFRSSSTNKHKGKTKINSLRQLLCRPGTLLLLREHNTLPQL